MSEGNMIMTVNGAIQPSQLNGPALMHEHLSMDFSFCRIKDAGDSGKTSCCGSSDLWKLQNIGYIQQNPYKIANNLILNDATSEKAIMDDVSKFASAGGKLIVENSTDGLVRKSTFLRDVQNLTGVYVVAGTGCYVSASQTQEKINQTEDELCEFMRSELDKGCIDEPSVKCGFIGEIGVTWPMHDFEKRTIRACATLTNSEEFATYPVSFHPGRDAQSPEEIIRVFEEASDHSTKKKVIMSHVERTLKDKESLVELASKNVYCQFDLFGIENSYYGLAPHLDFPSDAQRMDSVIDLISGGFENRILMSHDIHTKHRLEEFGGHGFSHILRNVLPKMVDVKHVDRDVMNKIMIENPRDVLTITKK